MYTIPQFLAFPAEEDSKEMVSFFLKILEHKNRKLYLHSQQVANYATSICVAMGLPPEDIVCVNTAALLHDIGHLAVPNRILERYPFLSTKDMATYKKHCVAGSSMLENLPDFSHVMKMILYHHEHWDGSGYPKRLKGMNIPLGSRIIAVANYYDRTLNPCYLNWSKAHHDAVKELRDLAGLHFDPAVVEAFLSTLLSEKIETTTTAQ